VANDEITFRDGMAVYNKPDGTTIEISIEELFRLAAPPRIDSYGVALPREVRFAYSRDQMSILACEYPAGPYTLSWIAEDSKKRYGTGTKYRKVTLSLPYVIVLAVFQNGQLSTANECFFRTAPLTDIDSENELQYPGLLNCSRHEPPAGRPLAWICTQKLDHAVILREKEPRRRMRASLEALRHCLFEASFNYSSDDHEFSSWYMESRSVDKRIETVDRWHEETQKDRFMGLDIPWLSTGLNLRQVVDRIYQNHHIQDGGVRHERQLHRLMINHEKKQQTATS